MKVFHKEPDEKIVHDYADKHKQEITEKLNTAMQVWTRKYDITIQQKAGGETDQKGDNERRNMRLNGNKSQMKYLLL